MRLDASAAEDRRLGEKIWPDVVIWDGEIEDTTPNMVPPENESAVPGIVAWRGKVRHTHWDAGGAATRCVAAL